MNRADFDYAIDCLEGCADKILRVTSGTTYVAVARRELREAADTILHYTKKLRLGGGDQIPPPVDELESTPPGSVLPSSLPSDIDFDHEWLREFAIEADLDERRLG